MLRTLNIELVPLLALTLYVLKISLNKYKQYISNPVNQMGRDRISNSATHKVLCYSATHFRNLLLQNHCTHIIFSN